MSDEQHNLPIQLQYWILQGRTLVLEQRAGSETRRLAHVQATGNLESDLRDAYLEGQPVPHEQKVAIMFTNSQVQDESMSAFYSMSRNGERWVYFANMDPFEELERLAFKGDWDESVAYEAKKLAGLVNNDEVPKDSIEHRRFQALGHIYQFSDIGLTDKVEELKAAYKNKEYERDPSAESSE